MTTKVKGQQLTFKFLGVVASLSILAVGTPANASEVAASTNVAGTEEPRVFIVGSGDQTFAEQVSSTVESGGASREVMVQVLERLEATAAVGTDVNLPGSDGPASQDVTSIQEAEQNLDSPPNREEGLSTAAVPDLFQLRGSAGSGGFAWNFNTVIAGRFCGASGCGDDTDRITIRWTINPGRTGDLFQFNSTYFPDAGAFSNIYAEGFAYCNGNLCNTNGEAKLIGAGGARDGDGRGNVSVPHTSNAGGRLTNGVRMRATGPGGTIFDYAKTGQALCRTGSDPNCVY